MNNYTSTDWTNQKKMDTFPATHNLPRLNNEEIENLNQLIISRDWFKNWTPFVLLTFYGDKAI